MTVVEEDVDACVQELARAHHCRLVAAMALVCGDVSEAEDAVQDAFVALWQTLRAGKLVTSPRSWLMTVSMNRLRSGWRRQAVQARYLSGLTPEARQRHVDPDLADAIVLHGALAMLPLRQRQAAVLYYLLDLSVAEAAAVMGTSAGMVKNALFRARRKMAASLGETDDGQAVKG